MKYESKQDKKKQIQEQKRRKEQGEQKRNWG